MSRVRTTINSGEMSDSPHFTIKVNVSKPREEEEKSARSTVQQQRETTCTIRQSEQPVAVPRNVSLTQQTIRVQQTSPHVEQPQFIAAQPRGFYVQKKAMPSYERQSDSSTFPRKQDSVQTNITILQRQAPTGIELRFEVSLREFLLFSRFITVLCLPTSSHSPRKIQL